MKSILINDTIYVLDNHIRRIYKETRGTGAKSNPLCYFIRIEYHGEILAKEEEIETKEEMDALLNEIYAIINEK